MHQTGVADFVARRGGANNLLQSAAIMARLRAPVLNLLSPSVQGTVSAATEDFARHYAQASFRLDAPWRRDCGRLETPHGGISERACGGSQLKAHVA